jgi:amino acid transporter
MPNPSKTLPRAMIASILLVMLLYVAIAFAVFGNLSVNKVVAAKDFALAQAALPIFGHIGFSLVAVTALIATASAINANLYAVTNVTYQLAKDGELPSLYGRPILHSREGLVVSGIFVIISLLLFDLSEIASIGSVSMLFIHSVTHIGHLRLSAETGASRILVVLAALFSSVTMMISLIYIYRESDHVIIILIGFVLVAVITEISLRKLNKKEIRPRVQNS